MANPKYHWSFSSISWLSNKSVPKAKLSATGKLSTIGKLPYLLLFERFQFSSKYIFKTTKNRKNMLWQLKFGYNLLSLWTFEQLILNVGLTWHFRLFFGFSFHFEKFKFFPRNIDEKLNNPGIQWILWCRSTFWNFDFD